MPYTKDSKLPTYVEGKPEHIKTKWIEIFNRVYAKEGESMAFYVANTWLKKQKTFLKRSVITFEVDDSEGFFLKRSDDGEDYITLKLGSSEKHHDGKSYSPELLQRWADKINNGEMVIGDIDHEQYDSLMGTSMTDEMIRQTLKMKKGIAKGVKALIKNGVLYLRTWIDKRYRKIVEKCKGVSAEAFVSYGQDETVEDGELLGFSFNLNTTPADPGAGVVA
jgi:hypothetical protein